MSKCHTLGRAKASFRAVTGMFLRDSFSDVQTAFAVKSQIQKPNPTCPHQNQSSRNKSPLNPERETTGSQQTSSPRFTRSENWEDVLERRNYSVRTEDFCHGTSSLKERAPRLFVFTAPFESVESIRFYSADEGFRL